MARGLEAGKRRAPDSGDHPIEVEPVADRDIGTEARQAPAKRQGLWVKKNMSAEEKRSKREEKLRQGIEALALELVLASDQGGGGGARESIRKIAPALTKLRQEAENAERSDVARIATAVCENIEAAKKKRGGPDLAALEQAIEAGISQLQQAIERPPQPEPEPAAPAADRPAAGSLVQDPELLSDFVVESREHLSSIEGQLLALEQDPHNAEAVHSVFRSFHTIKGLAGFLELTAVQEVAHEVETALDLARNARLAITPPVIDVALESADFLRKSIEQLEGTLHGKRAKPPSGSAGLLERIRRLTGAGQREETVATAPEAQKPAEGEEERSTPTGPQTVKVDTVKLDYMVDMVGEMVIAQSLLRHDESVAAIQSPKLIRNLSQLARITNELQKTAMSMRMVPIGRLFQRTARLVRDLARKAGKRVELVTSGEDTELDRTIVEELADPLMHLVRNAVDHGIEAPAERAAAGKQPTGKITLRACHQAGQILIEASDDGRGLCREEIVRRARQRGLLHDGDALSESEASSLIFEPGFSTAAEVTEISGRGVGLDVVKKQVQKLRGRIEVHSTPGKGTKFLLKLPLTLAIIEGLVVKIGAERYIVPLFSVREMLRPSEGMISTLRSRDEMAMVRGRLLPLVRLYRLFGVRPRSEDPCQCLLIVAENGSRPFCLMVDDLVGKQEVVIKSLGGTMKNIPGIAGGAILGDGRVGLILDLEGIFGGRADDSDGR